MKSKENANRKRYEPLDSAALDVIDELRAGMSGTELGRRSGIKHNRMAKILRRDTPPATISELEAIAAVFDRKASDIVGAAEAALNVSQDDLAARRERAADEVAAADARGDLPDGAVAHLSDDEPDEQ